MSSDALGGNLAISVRGLAKSYPIRTATPRPTLLWEVVRDRLRHPLKRAPRERFWALQDVDFDVGRGEVLGIIGPNGAGKSTLLKILSRITDPTRGEARLRGRVGSLLEVGTGFHPELTGRENVFLNGSILGMKRQEIARQFDAIVDFAGVEKFIDVPVKRYSSGMSVRLAFAIAARVEPEILIVDEVLAVGDAEFQKKCLGKMSEVATMDARTVLFVSHNMAAVESLCDRVLHIEAGRVVFDGTPSDAIAHYLSSRGPQGVSTPGEFELHDRRGLADTAPIVRKVTLVSEGHITDTVRMGQNLKILADVVGYRDVPMQQLSVSIHAALQQDVTMVSTWMKPGRVPSHREEMERVVIDIDSLRLGPGQYTVSIGVWSYGYRSFDVVEDAAAFTVVASDVLGSGYAYELGEVVFFTDFDWEVQPQSAINGAVGSDVADRGIGSAGGRQF